MSNPRSSRTVMVLALAAALVTAGLVASPVVEQSAEASVGAAHAVPRSVGDDTVLGAFSPLGGGVDNEVYALAVQGEDTVYVGGRFTSALGVAGTSRIAAWSNADDTWHAIGGNTDGDVNALAVQGDDTVYAGGTFATIGGVTASRVAAWSTTDDTWHALGSGADNTVFAMAVQGDDTVYAGGRFGFAGGIPGTDYVAAWSNVDDTWHSLGGGTDDRVLSLVVSGDHTVYAGGWFETAGDVPSEYSARWTSADDTWRPLDGGTDYWVYALATQGDDTVYAGGPFSEAGGSPANQIAAWSSSDDTWYAFGGGTDSDVYSLAVDEAHGLVYAGGTFLVAGSLSVRNVAVWDTGISAWIPLQAAGGIGVGPNRSRVAAIALDDSTVLLGGAFTTAGGVTVNRIAKWTWGAPTVEAVPASGAHGTTIQVRGSRLIGVSGVFVNGSPAAYTRDDSTTVSVTIPGNLYNGTYSIQVDAVGGSATTSYTVTGSPAPPPPPPRPVPAMTPASQAMTGVAGVAVTPTSAFTLANFTAPVRYSIYPPLPTGLALDPATGIVTGTPAAAYPSTRHWITASTAGGSESASSLLTITVDPARVPSAPLDVTATAGDRSARVSWMAPTDPGTLPISSYEVTASPGGSRCTTTSLSCDVTGLVNGTAYTFTATATSAAGTSLPSASSAPVTPRAVTIMITGSRSGREISVTGSSTGLGTGAILKPWVRFPGDGSAQRGAVDILVGSDGSFSWHRRAGKRLWVYVATVDGLAKSNTVAIAARS